jgi:precorrin-2 dehydrogenase/sirohydrochlorin ferrochelatase
VICRIAISTNGKSPALAQRLRIELESLYDDSYAEWLQWLGEVRDLYSRSRLTREKRVRTLHEIASRPMFELFRAAQWARRSEVDHG